MKVEINSTQFNHFIKQSNIIKADSIFIDATVSSVELIKCDIENQVTYEINANISEPGSIVLPKEVFPLIKENSIMTILNDRIIIGARVIKLDLISGIDYPRINDNFKYDVFELTDKELKHLMEVEHAISDDLTKPILNGIRIEKNKFISIDGYRLCERIGNFKSDVPITISNYKMLKGLKGTIKATCSERYIKYQVGDLNFYNRLTEGDFIEVDKLKPREHNTVLEVDKKEIQEILNSMNKLSAKIKNQCVKFSIRDKLLHVSTKNETMSLEDTIKIDKHGDDLDIAFNCRYLLDAVKHMDKIKMSFTTNVNPVIIECDDKYELILPVRIAVSV